jgi:hypothetical protein
MEPQGFNTTIEIEWDSKTFKNETIKGQIKVYTKQVDGSTYLQNYFIEVNNLGVRFHNNGNFLPYVHQYIYSDLEMISMTYYKGIKRNSIINGYFRVKEIE